MDMEPRKIGRYKIVSILGSSDSGTVYKAFDTAVERFVALKTFRKDIVFDWKATAEFAAFRAEAQAAGRLWHPRILAVYDYGEEPSVAYIAMELVSGRTLSWLLKKGEPVPPAMAAGHVAQVLAALAYAHSRGVVHGALSPANVVLLDGGGIKVKAFLGGQGDGRPLLPDQLPPDQAAYLPPEQIAGQPPDARSDIFAAGALLYALLTGRPAFAGPSRVLRDDAVVITPDPPGRTNPAIPPALETVVMRALAKSPEERFQTIEEFAKALELATADLPKYVAAPASAKTEAPAHPAGRRTAQRRLVRPGEIIFQEGDPGDAAFIIESGVVQIYKIGPGGSHVVLATIGRGEIMGEMALVDNQPRMAAAKAVEETILVVIPRQEFQARLERIDKVTHRLIAVLVSRVRGLADEVRSLKTLVEKR